MPSAGQPNRTGLGAECRGLAGVAVLLAAAAVYEWLTGESLHHVWLVRRRAA